MLKTNDFIRRLMRVTLLTSAEFAGPRVSLCRAKG